MSALDGPRSLFAAERTLLAWQRTSIVLMGFGFVVERFGRLLRMMVTHQLLSTSLLDYLLWLGVGVWVAVVSALQRRAAAPQEVSP